MIKYPETYKIYLIINKAKLYHIVDSEKYMPEMRQNPVTEQWVIIATERAKRPEQTNTKHRKEDLPAHDESCFFCWGNEETTPPEVYAVRLDDAPPNSPGWLLRVVENKFAALNMEQSFQINDSNYFHTHSYATGTAEVIIETNNHSLSPSNFSLTQTIRVLKSYIDRYKALSELQDIKYINIFRNCGASAGASLKHPHSQIIAIPLVPPNVKVEMEGALKYFERENRCVWCDELQNELKAGVRIIFENKYFVCYAPYASRIPFEMRIVPKYHAARFEETDLKQLHALAEVWKSSFFKLDEAVGYPPYNCFIHTAPLHESIDECFHWHIEIIPKLTIAAGFELCTGMFINVTIPEDCADYLRNIDVVF
jgi:UDPglucose--hexose-1-phosphate uridylyltransferase